MGFVVVAAIGFLIVVALWLVLGRRGSSSAPDQWVDPHANKNIPGAHGGGPGV